MSTTVLRRRIAVALDVAAVACLILVVVIARKDGFIADVAGVRISFRDADQTVLWLCAIGGLRLTLFRGRGVLGRVPARWIHVEGVRAADPIAANVAPGFWVRTLMASLGIGIVVAALLHDQLLQPYSVPDWGDPLFSIWRIDAVIQGLLTDPLHLFDANIFYPERLTLTLSDPLILPALTAGPFLGVGIHPVIAYNLMLFSGFWLSGVATYLLVERLTGSARAAFVSGLVYACAAFRFDHYPHLELQMTQWMPVGLLALHLLVATGRWRYAAALGIAVVAQLYSAMYYAVFFVIYAAIVGGGLLLLYRPPPLRLLRPLAVVGLIAAVLALPLMRAFAAAAPIRGERSIGEVRYYSAELSDYFRANGRSATWRERLPPASPERALFPGVMPLALAAIGLAPPFTAVSVVYGAGLAASVDLSLGFNGFSYQYLYRWLPPVRGLRVPARFIAVVTLTLAILAGLGVRRLLRAAPGRVGQGLTVAVLAAAITFDAWPALTLRPVWKEPPWIYAYVPPGAVLAELPTPENEAMSIVFMYFSLWHQARMVNGYSGYVPRSYIDGAKPELLAFAGGESIDALRRRGVTHLTVNCALQYSKCAQIVRVMEASPDLREIAKGTWEGERVALYEIVRD